MDGDMLTVLLSGIGIMLVVCVSLIVVRQRNLYHEHELEQKSLESMV
jgi:hypothetical protein